MKRFKQILFVCSFVLLLYSMIKIITIKKDERNSKEAIPQFISAMEKKEAEINTFINEIEGSIGWLTIAQTESINLPIMQTDNNEYYLSHDAFGNENIFGAAFLEAEIDSENKHLIIHGHSTYEPLMFTELKYFLDSDYVQKNPSFLYYDKKGTYLCEIVSAYSYQPTDLSHYAFDEQGYQEYLDLILSYNTISSSAVITSKDRLITLSTCDMRDTSYRILVHAKMTEITKIDIIEKETE